MMYEKEVAAVDQLSLRYSLISYEALVHEINPEKAVQRVEPLPDPELGVYRGWMLKPHHYQRLYDALAHRGIHLINNPTAYKHCHYLPESYSIIEGYTPKSVWVRVTTDVSMDEIIELLRPFNSKPVIVKDFVKSQKHYWNEACYIPSASDVNAVERVVRRFLELQGDDLNEGLVFREFVEFEPLATHSKSGMPLTKEFRVFFLDGKPIYTAEYWEQGDYAGVNPGIDRFLDVAKAVESRFFTMDIAKRRDSDWMIVELGDGQVAGLPERASVFEFYRALTRSQ